MRCRCVRSAGGFQPAVWCRPFRLTPRSRFEKITAALAAVWVRRTLRIHFRTVSYKFACSAVEEQARQRTRATMSRFNERSCTESILENGTFLCVPSTQASRVRR